jgi:hypothetical protein
LIFQIFFGKWFGKEYRIQNPDLEKEMEHFGK